MGFTNPARSSLAGGTIVRATRSVVIRLENAPGQLARVASALGEADVNILGFSAHEEGQEGTVHLLTEDPDKAADVLEELGLDPVTKEALAVTLPNRAGELGRVSRRLADSGVNIDATFPTVSPRGPDVQIAFVCDDPASAHKVLEDVDARR